MASHRATSVLVIRINVAAALFVGNALAKVADDIAGLRNRLELYGKAPSDRVSRFYLCFVGILNLFCHARCQRLNLGGTRKHLPPLARVPSYYCLTHQIPACPGRARNLVSKIS